MLYQALMESFLGERSSHLMGMHKYALVLLVQNIRKTLLTST
jgi:hypothetical protein